MLDALGIQRLVSLERGMLDRGDSRARRPPPEDLRLALEELGPTFVKLGQVLSTRADLLPPEYRTEFAKLQDQVAPIPAEVVQEILAEELHGGVEEAFARFESEPVAAASIGQAHAAALLRDGTEVIVKVQRPGVVEEIQQDLEIVQNLAARASRRWQAAATYDLVGLAEEFGQSLLAEVDYLQEGRNAERFKTNFADEPAVQIPRVFWEFTTSRIITLERIYGMKLSDLASLDAAGIDRHAVAQRAATVTARMVFEHGFFHADPHPGNFFVQPDAHIGIIDFGLVGRVDERLRERLQDLLVAFARADPDRLASALIALGATTRPPHRTQFREDLRGLLARYTGRGIGEIPLGPALSDMFEVVRRHGLRIPRDLALLVEVIVMDEGLAAELDPGFSFTEALEPFARRLVTAQLSPRAILRRLERTGFDAAELVTDLPGQLHRALDTLGDGSLEVRLQPDDLEPMLARAERLGNRIAVSVLAASLIDGIAQIIATDRANRRSGRRRGSRRLRGRSGR
jgi:ubiquinone biosynthesis protein